MKKIIFLILMLVLVVFLASCDGVILPPSEEKLANNGGSEISGIETEDISNLKPQDQGSEPDPDSTEIGDTFVGSTGTTYKLQEENISEQEKKDLADLGFIASGVWVPVDEDSDTGGNGGINTGGITITDTGGAGMMGDNPAEDIAVMPVGAQVGDTWTGPSGQTYIATFSNPELVSELAAQGIIVTPYWAPVGGN